MTKIIFYMSEGYNILGSGMFKGEKTKVFWRGLIIFGLAITVLFTVFWYVFVLDYGYYISWRWWTPVIFGGAVFLLIGLYMMIAGVEKRETQRANPP